MNPPTSTRTYSGTLESMSLWLDGTLKAQGDSCGFRCHMVMM